MNNQLFVEDVELDLDEGTVILPSFQANDLSKPDTIQADFSPQFSLPATQRNHQVLGHAAYASSLAGVPYTRLSARLLSEGAEIMPRALLFLKGYEAGRYQVQLFAGNRRFAAALGEKRLRDLDFSRFTHSWTFDEVAARLPLSYWQENGWGYEVYDRGQPVNITQHSPYHCLPSVSARLIWEQLLQEAGFTATPLDDDALFSKLTLPATTVAGYGDDFTEARRTVTGISGQEVVGERDKDDHGVLEFIVPFNFAPAGTDPYRLPTAPGVWLQRQENTHGESYPYHVFHADAAMLLTIEARLSLHFKIGFGTTCRATLSLYKNGQKWIEGTGQEDSGRANSLTVNVTATRERVAEGDEIYCMLRLESPTFGGGRWGFFELFSGRYAERAGSLPDQFTLEVVDEVPPGGIVRLQDWLPDLSQLDFFRALVQVLGLTVQTDNYQDRLHLGFSADVLRNTTRALDWTGKRDQPAGPPGVGRNVVYRFGSYARRNTLSWLPDDTNPVPGLGDGALLVADANLPAEFSLGTLPFAATQNSAALPGGLRISSWRREEDGGYTMQEPKPRLTLRTGQELGLTLVEGEKTQALVIVLSYFLDPLADDDLDAQRTILRRYWAGLGAMLREARAHKERYRLSQLDIIQLDYTVPIWDGVLGDYFAISRISEFSAQRPTEVELVRLHPAAVAANRAADGLEYSEEFDTLTEFY